MITEQAKEAVDRKKIENGIQMCEETIAKAEKYERLKENKDWQGYLADLAVNAELHDNEIKMGQTMLIDAPTSGYVKSDDFGKQVYVSGLADWTAFIMRHLIQKQEALNWIREPEYIMSMAALAREKLPILKQKLEELGDGPKANGKQ